MLNNEDKNSGSDFLKKQYTILDLLNHEVNTTIGADKTLKRLERVIMNPEVLKNLTFEQIMTYWDKVMRRQEKSYAFIIDFYRVTSKSQDIQSTLKQHTIDPIECKQTTDGEVISSENEVVMKQRLLERLDKLLKEQEENEE